MHSNYYRSLNLYETLLLKLGFKYKLISNTTYWRRLEKKYADLRLISHYNLSFKADNKGEVKVKDIIVNKSKISVNCRLGNSDIKLLKQQFIDLEYGPVIKYLNDLIGQDKVKFIVDCGSNIGFSTIVWKCFFKDAKIICVEPDVENFELLERNLRYNFPDLSNFHLLRKGLWHSDEFLQIDQTFRDSNSWSISLKPLDKTNFKSNTPAISGVTLSQIITSCNLSIIDLLKLDIEGGEYFLLEDKNSLKLIQERVKIFVIELHPDAGVNVNAFVDMMLGLGFMSSLSGEYHIFLNNNIIDN